MTWIACTQPERPWDDDISYHLDCRACLIAFDVATATGVRPGAFNADLARQILFGGIVDRPDLRAEAHDGRKHVPESMVVGHKLR